MVSTLMTTRIVAITPDAPVSTALNLMASAGVRHLPVLHSLDWCGVLQEIDVLRHLVAGPASPADRAATPIAQLTRPAPSLPASARRSDVARCMDADTDAVLVTGPNGLVGIVTSTDLVRSLADRSTTRAARIMP